MHLQKTLPRPHCHPHLASACEGPCHAHTIWIQCKQYRREKVLRKRMPDEDDGHFEFLNSFTRRDIKKARF